VGGTGVAGIGKDHLEVAADRRFGSMFRPMLLTLNSCHFDNQLALLGMSKQAPAGLPPILDLMYPTLEALKVLGGSGHISEIDSQIAGDLGLSDEVVEYRDHRGDRLQFNWRCAWARTHLRGGDAIENTARGVWAVTPTGRALTPDQMSDILTESQRAARSKRSDSGKSGADVSPEDEASLTWEEELLTVLLSMEPDAFERLAQRVLRQSNFSKVEVTGRSGDGGIDGHGVLNIELISFQVLFQCKRYKDTVGAGAIRDFRGAMVGRTDKGLFITTGRFTSDARREATRDGAQPIDLIDGPQLCEILKNLQLGVATKFVEEIEISKDFFQTI